MKGDSLNPWSKLFDDKMHKKTQNATSQEFLLYLWSFDFKKDELTCFRLVRHLFSMASPICKSRWEEVWLIYNEFIKGIREFALLTNPQVIKFYCLIIVYKKS